MPTSVPRVKPLRSGAVGTGQKPSARETCARRDNELNQITVANSIDSGWALASEGLPVKKRPKTVENPFAAPTENVELAPEIGKGVGRPGFRSILGSLTGEIADAFKPPATQGLQLWLRKREPLVNPLIAPDTTMRKLNLSLAEKQRIYDRGKIADLWTLYFDFRSQFPRPDESDAAVRRLCMDWKRKYRGRSPLSLQRFFRQHPNLAVWATWTEQAIQETPIRSSKNKFPRLELLRECMRIMAQHQLDHFGMW
jgi:hypothetical protein